MWSIRLEAEAKQPKLDHQKIIEMGEQMLANRHVPSTYGLNLMLFACIETKQPERALHIMHKATVHFSRTLIPSFSLSLSLSFALPSALMSFQEYGVPSNVATHCASMEAYALANQFEKSLRVFNDTRKLYPGNIRVYNAFLRCCLIARNRYFVFFFPSANCLFLIDMNNVHRKEATRAADLMSKEELQPDQTTMKLLTRLAEITDVNDELVSSSFA